MALLDPAPVTSHQPITKAEATEFLSTGTFGDEAVLKIVIQDAERAETYEASKSWVAGWQAAQGLYQSPFTARYWEGTSTPRSSISFYTLATAVNSLVPQIMGGLFYDDPPFLMQERDATKAQEARAVSDVLAYQLEDINFKLELELGAKNALVFGTSIWKWGWESFTRERKIYKRKNPQISEKSPVPGASNITLHPSDEDIVEETIEDTVSRPTFEHMANLRYVLVDPALNVPDISKSKWVIHRMYMSWEDIDKLRDRPGFDIPSREKLLELFLPPREPVEQAQGESGTKNPMWDMRAESRFADTTIDPFKEPLEILERWTPDSCQIVLQKKAVIYNGTNEYGKIPFLSVGWWDVPEAFYSMGLAKTVGSEQQIQQGIVNTWLDCVTLNLNPIVKRVRGKSVESQSVRMSPGKVYNVDNKDDISYMDRTPAVPEAGEHIAMSQSRVDMLAGAGALNTSGMAAGHSNLARTAAGAQMLGSSGTTVPNFVDKISNQVFLPFLYRMQEMNAALLPMQDWKRILSDELQHEYAKQNEDLISLLNARVKFSIAAGAKMQSRQKMAQAIPILFQLVGNEQTSQQMNMAGKRVDYVELVHMLFETSEFKTFNDVIVDMSPEEMQRAQANSPAAKMQMQVQAQQQQQQQKHADDLDLDNASNVAKAGREVLRVALEKATTPFELTGDAGGGYSPQ